MSIILISFSQLCIKIGAFILPKNEDQKEENRKLFDQKSKEEGSFDFTLLSPKILNNLVEKLDYQDCANLAQTSKFTAELLKEGIFAKYFRVNTILINLGSATFTMSEPYEEYNDVRRIPWTEIIKNGVRISATWLIFEDYIEGYKLQKLIKLFEATQTRISQIFLDQGLDSEPEHLERLIKTIKPYEMACRQFLSKKFFYNEMFENLERVTIFFTDATDEEFLAVKFYSHLQCTMDNISVNGLNRLLKEWKSGEREFDCIRIHFESSRNSRNFDEILDGLEANPIWTPALHDQSIISPISYDDFWPILSGDPSHLYSIWRSDNIFDPLFIKLQMGEFIAYKSISQNERQLLEYELDEYQFYKVTGKMQMVPRVYW